MTANKYAGTQTEKNLQEAFAGESQARNKYTYFASVAKKEGYEQMSALFLKTADNEKEHAKKKVWLNIYNASDNFLSSTYQPLLQNYDDLLNLDVEYIGGDGQTESNVTNRLGNPSQYDAFAINMVKTDNASSYTSLLK